MRLKSSLILFLLLCAGIAQGQGLSATFIIRNAGFNVDGKFTEATIKHRFNPKILKEAYFNAEISVGSIDTGIKARDRHLLKDGYFDVANFPSMTFTSSSISKEGDQYFVLGTLSIKGISKVLKTPLTITNKELAVEFEINRRDFNVGGNSFILSDMVKVKLVLSPTF
jgi:polyisoprenoid-binding protein YceI